VVEYLPETGCGRSIELRSNKTAGKHGRHTRNSNKARTVDNINQTRMMKGWAKREKSSMAEEAVSAGVVIAKRTQDVADSNSKNARQFENLHDGITSAIRFIVELKSSKIITEVTGNYEIPLAAALQASRLLGVIVNPRQIRDFARATSVQAKTDKIDAGILALFSLQIKPEVKPIPDKQSRDMGNLLTHRRQLIEMLTSEHNRLLQADEDIRPGIEIPIKWLEDGLSDINDNLNQQIRNSPAYLEKDNLVKSVLGLGKWYQPLSLLNYPNWGNLTM
jgi:transposase